MPAAPGSAAGHALPAKAWGAVPDAPGLAPAVSPLVASSSRWAGWGHMPAAAAPKPAAPVAQTPPAAKGQRNKSGGGPGAAKPGHFGPVPTVAKAKAVGGGGGGGGGATTGRGRPPNDVKEEIDKMAKSWAQADASDVLFWGAEHKTTVAKMKRLVTDVKGRIEKSVYVEELRPLLQSEKVITTVLSLHEYALKFGVEKQVFSELFDAKVTYMKLEPETELIMPAHLLWARHRLDIAASVNSQAWMAKVATAALTANGLASLEVPSEQGNLLMAKLAPMLRAPEKSEMIAQMKGTFSIQVNFERQGFSEDVAEFASVVTIFAHLDDFTLEQVLQYVDMAVNLFASDLSKNEILSKLCSLFLTFPAGTALVEKAKALLTEAKRVHEQTQKKRQLCSDVSSLCLKSDGDDDDDPMDTGNLAECLDRLTALFEGQDAASRFALPKSDEQIQSVLAKVIDISRGGGLQYEFMHETMCFCFDFCLRIVLCL